MIDSERLLRLQKEYNEILLNDGGFKTLCTTLSENINNPVYILDKYKEDVLYIDGCEFILCKLIVIIYSFILLCKK